MRSRIAAAALVMISLAGCQMRPPEIEVTDTPASTGVPNGGVTDIDDALLTEADLPGYTRTEAPISPAAGMSTSMAQCADSDQSTAAPAREAHALFQGGPSGPFLAETMTSMSEADATRFVTGLARVRENCGSFDGGTPGGMRLRITIGSLSFPRFGDDTAAFRLTGTVEQAGAAVYAHVIAIRRGGLVMMIVLMRLGSPDVTETLKLVRTAYGKL
jgi:hypothetical protein